jgi:hypothetical protein
MRANSGLGKWTNYAGNRSQPPIWLHHNQPRFGLPNATHHLFLHLDLDCFCDWYKLGNDDHHVPAHRSSVLRSLSGRSKHCVRCNCWHFGCEFTQGLDIKSFMLQVLIYYSRSDLQGAVAGDHASPISDTTILGAMASECKLLNHVKTQAPYAFYVAVWSILVGTLPSGMGKMSNSICILLGFLAMVFMAFVPAGEPFSFSNGVSTSRILTMTPISINSCSPE